MIEILKECPYPQVDYELVNGDLLRETDWNGICYHNKKTGETWTPVFRYQIEGINIENLDENSREWIKAMDLIGFTKY